MDESLLSKIEVPGSSLLGHLLKKFSLRLTWCLWLVGYYDKRRLVEVRVNWSGHPRYLKKNNCRMLSLVGYGMLETLDINLSRHFEQKISYKTF